MFGDLHADRPSNKLLTQRSCVRFQIVWLFCKQNDYASNIS
jgi:hypothetical protein